MIQVIIDRIITMSFHQTVRINMKITNCFINHMFQIIRKDHRQMDGIKNDMKVLKQSIQLLIIIIYLKYIIAKSLTLHLIVTIPIHRTIIMHLLNNHCNKLTTAIITVMHLSTLVHGMHKHYDNLHKHL